MRAWVVGVAVAWVRALPHFDCIADAVGVPRPVGVQCQIGVVWVGARVLARVGAIGYFVVVADAIAVLVRPGVGGDRDLARRWITDVDVGVVLALAAD